MQNNSACSPNGMQCKLADADKFKNSQCTRAVPYDLLVKHIFGFHSLQSLDFYLLYQF